MESGCATFQLPFFPPPTLIEMVWANSAIAAKATMIDSVVLSANVLRDGVRDTDVPGHLICLAVQRKDRDGSVRIVANRSLAEIRRVAAGEIFCTDVDRHH